MLTGCGQFTFQSEYSTLGISCSKDLIYIFLTPTCISFFLKLLTTKTLKEPEKSPKISAL